MVKSLCTWEGWASIAIVILMVGIFLLSFEIIGLVFEASPQGASNFMEPGSVSATDSPQEYSAKTWAIAKNTVLPRPPEQNMSIGKSSINCSLTDESSIILPSESVLRCDYEILLWSTEAIRYIEYDSLLNESKNGTTEVVLATGERVDMLVNDTQYPPPIDDDRFLSDRVNVTWTDWGNRGPNEINPDITSSEPVSIENRTATFVGEFIITAPPTAGRFELSLELRDTRLTEYRNAKPVTSRLKVLSISELVLLLQVLIVVGLEVSLFKLLLDLIERIDDKLSG